MNLLNKKSYIFFLRNLVRLCTFFGSEAFYKICSVIYLCYISKPYQISIHYPIPLSLYIKLSIQLKEESIKGIMSFSSSDAMGSSILSDKVTRALEVRTDTPAMKAALEALSHLPSESMDSRSVRVAIEQDALQQAILLQEELKALVMIVASLRTGVTETANIARQVHDAINCSVVSSQTSVSVEPVSSDSTMKMPDHLHLSSEDSLGKEQQLAAMIADAFVERDLAAQRADTVAAFLEKFDLSEHDSDLLDQYNFEDIEEENNAGMQFLDALDRVKEIRQDMTTSFGNTTSSVSELFGEDSHQRFGATSAIRMMESLSIKQERAYERLYHWLQKYLHLNSVTHVPTSSGAVPNTQDLVDSDALDEALSHPFVKRSLKVLYHVPAFYSHTLELIASSRRAEETRRFLLALTAGYNGRSPIELKAHDPITYVGDMLAFCFQSCSVESDVAKGLVVQVDEFLEVDSTMTMTAADMLYHAMSGLARPLKARVLQVIASLARRPDDDGDDADGVEEEEEDVVARSRVSSLYSICGLLLFYRAATQKTIGKLGNKSENSQENPLITSLTECLQEATNAFVASLKVYSAILESLAILSGNTEASLVQSMIEQLSHVRMTSPGFVSDVHCPLEFETTLGMEFLVETLLLTSIALCKTLDDSVTLKRSLVHAKKAGLSTTIASQLDGRISEAEQSLIDELIQSETKEVLEICGLGQVISAWRNLPPFDGITMATQPGLNMDDMDLAMKEFYASLYSPPLPNFENIKDPVLRKLARHKIAMSVVNVYEELYNAILSDKGGYDDTTFLGHTPDQVKSLFAG
jgi:conserved oligomeric Golgi complex subunit 6